MKCERCGSSVNGFDICECYINETRNLNRIELERRVTDCIIIVQRLEARVEKLERKHKEK